MCEDIAGYCIHTDIIVCENPPPPPPPRHAYWICCCYIQLEAGVDILQPTPTSIFIPWRDIFLKDITWNLIFTMTLPLEHLPVARGSLVWFSFVPADTQNIGDKK